MFYFFLKNIRQNIVNNIEEFKTHYRDRIITYLKCVAVINHKTVLTGDCEPLIDCVWQWFESQTKIFPTPLTDNNIKLACEEVVNFYLTGETRASNKLKEWQEFSEGLKPRTEF